jgi:hypothetical protein
LEASVVEQIVRKHLVSCYAEHCEKGKVEQRNAHQAQFKTPASSL